MPKQKSRCNHQTRHFESRAETLKEFRSFRLHPAVNRKVIEDFFISLGTPIALSCYLLYKYEEYDQLVQKDIDPRSYNDVDRFRNDFAAISFLRKHGGLPTSIDRKEVALLGFVKAEETCKVSNQRIRDYLSSGKIYPDGERVLTTLVRKIERVLGTFDIDEVLQSCSWGPGVSQLIKGNDTSGARKFDVECEITRDAYYLFGETMKLAFPLWKAWDKVKFSAGNHIITVPKNAKTDRTIAIEPGLNIWVQLGIGKVLRRRLRFAGYNLNSDLKNQRGAYLGSLDDSLATIDFKAASDTISRAVVELLLPPVWFTVLNAARSQFYTLDGKTQRAEKFSTMGNGFTFELESLIFVCAALAICEVNGIDDSNVSVFGDDIVLPSCCVSEYTDLVGWLGFTVNREKSFSSGYFRESCGQYYFKGVDVKPLFLKKDLTYAKDLFRLANGVRNLSHRHNANCGCDSRFRAVWSLLVSSIPQRLRFRGPVASGDATIHVNLDETVARRSQEGWCGYKYTGVPEIPISIEKSSLGLLLARLHSPSADMPYGNNVPLRARTRMLLKRNMFVHQDRKSVV